MFSLTGIFFGHFPCFPCAEGTLIETSLSVCFVLKRYMRVISGNEVLVFAATFNGAKTHLVRFGGENGEIIEM